MNQHQIIQEDRHMEIDLRNIRPNPFRDFDLYPLDDEQVRRLAQSINSIGFFASVTARPDGKEFQLASGHHRIAAAKKAGLTKVYVLVKPYTDAEMVRIMTLENLTQRGHNAASVLDSVAAYSRMITFEVLLGKGDAAKILAASPNTGTLASAQTTIAADGPGKDLIYRAINGFSRAERKENKDAEQITETEISQALGSLKAGGMMGRIVARSYADVEAARAIRDAEEKAKADRDAKSATEEKARAKAEAAEKERRTKEKAAVEKQAAAESKYDVACGNVFRLTSHENAFRESVTSPNGIRFIPVDKQVELAKLVRAEIDTVEDKRRHDLGSVTIKQIVDRYLREAIEQQTEIEEAEKRALLEQDATKRAHAKWKQLTAAIQRVETIIGEIAEMSGGWDYSNPFPIEAATLERIGLTATQITKFKKQLGF